jgi:hypothetical protein
MINIQGQNRFLVLVPLAALKSKTVFNIARLSESNPSSADRSIPKNRIYGSKP